ncbi:TetR/AcrR family transcriptional regulator [Streptomyces sp. NPDC048172]|uniref:TetR/AcrR family transcriptional regulator n=1 Tax=Streptomyces sp. NPDC048172 TaxID=3365505 RepID=UPI003715CA4E
MTQGSRTGDGRRTSVWWEERPAPRRRAGGSVAQPEGLDRERITATAVRMLDVDGLARFSMRRLAAELGVTAMSVYWYVDSKDELLELALDAAQGELEEPGGAGGAEGAEGAGDWRPSLRAVAHDLRALLRRHPWIPALLGRCLNVGPRAMTYAAGVRGLLLRAGVPERQADGALSALFSFVYGHGAVETGWDDRCRKAGLSPEECRRALRVRMRERPEYGESAYGESVPVVGQRDGQDAREREFAVALDCVIEGIRALTIAAAPAAPAAPAELSRTAVTPPAPPGCPARP